ncbi:MAG: hypothetical protein KAW87_05985 [Candidatus Cloacimonetes bacterium]|nr:hypothetical protein [Candidatus Cloacimonadota bacterium]
MKKEIKQNREIQVKKPTIKLQDYQKNLIIFVVVFLLLLIVFSPMAFQGMRPGGVDVIGSRGKTHQKKEFAKETGETVYWNSPVFSGMPIYHRISGKVFSFDTILNKILDKILYKYILIYLIGFIGMFFLLKFFNLNYWSAVFGALAFIFIPHYMSLLSIGHFAKFRPIMYIPLVTFFFISFLNKKNLLWLIGFIFAFSVQIRTQHYQIIFYQIMILVFCGLYYLIKMLKEKNNKEFFIKIILIVLSSVIIIMMVAQPLFVTGEYTPYSIRGGTGEKESTGLEIDYATSWSLHPAEILCWVMPRFFGGTSGEIYNGNKVSQLKGRQIPGYWGHMPFTQAYDYIGIVLLFFALLGLILNFKNGFIKTLLGLFVLSLLLSFGRHFPLIYNLFFKYVPQFNRFRVPIMISVIMQIIIVIWAGFGIKSLVEISKKDLKRIQKIIIGIAVFLIILGVIPLIFGNSFSLIKVGGETQYEPQVLSLIKSARLDMMQTDGLRLILFSVLTGLLSILFLSKKIKQFPFFICLFILLLIDQIPYVKKAEGKLQNPEKMEKEYFSKSSTNKILLQDTTYYRIFPITENPFNTNDWSYYHNSIGGYSAAKLRIYQDIIENFLNLRLKNPNEKIINWNVLKMLNTKYIISKKMIEEYKVDNSKSILKLKEFTKDDIITKNILPTKNIFPVYYDERNNFLIYKTKVIPQPAWFVGNIEIIPERKERFTTLNSVEFDPFQTAILEQEIDFSAKGGSFGEIHSPDSSFVKVKEASFNRMKYHIYTDKPTLFVVSEIYYPKGWRCFVDNEEAKIYKTNHILRSVYIDSQGEHEILFEFKPDTFIKNYHISIIGYIIAYLCLVVATIVTIYKKRPIKDN